MNTAILNRHSSLFSYGGPFFIVVIATILAVTTLPVVYPEMAVGIIIDLTVTAPLMFFFLNRKKRFLRYGVLGFFAVGVLIASYTIPVEKQGLLSLIKYFAVPLLEVGLLGVFAFSAYKTIKTYNAERETNADVLSVLQQVGSKFLGDTVFARLVAYEASVLYFAFFAWKAGTQNDQAFTYHKKNGTIATNGIFGFIIVAETIVFHYLIAQLNVYAAWVLTFSSIYLLMLIFAQVKATIIRPIEIIGDKLFIRYGVFGDAEIDLQNVASVETALSFSDEQDDLKKFAVFENCNTKIRLKEESTAYGFYRMKSKYRTLIFHADENEKLKKLIEENVPN